MIWHPLSLSILALDLLALAFVLSAVLTALKVLSRWDPASAGPEQIALEAATDGASLAARYGFVFFVAASLGLVLGITQVFPTLVQGAMCGSGVLEAMDGLGERALVLRVSALLALWAARSLDGVNRSAAQAPAVPTVARAQLLAVPLLVLAGLTTARALMALDPYAPVDCCQVTYGSFSTLSEASHTLGFSDTGWLWVFAAGASAFGLAIPWTWRRLRGEAPGLSRGFTSFALPSLALVWVPVAGVTLVRVLAAYHYEVLHHHCPWCLFLPAHKAVGYVLFGALLVIALESLAFLAVARLGRTTPVLAQAASRRQGRALLAMLIALLLFLGLSLGPAVVWRMAHGVWLHAS